MRGITKSSWECQKDFTGSNEEDRQIWVNTDHRRNWPRSEEEYITKTTATPPGTPQVLHFCHHYLFYPDCLAGRAPRPAIGSDGILPREHFAEQDQKGKKSFFETIIFIPLITQNKCTQH